MFRKRRWIFLFVIILVLFVASRGIEGQYATFVVEQRAALSIANVNDEKLERIDFYIRQSEGARLEDTHRLVVVPDSSYFSEFFGNRDYSGWTGASQMRYERDRFTDANGYPDIHYTSISIVTLFDSDAVQFGLILHELAHVSGADHGDGTQLGDANYWERIGNNAYNHNCGLNPFCIDVEGIIYND